MVERRWVALGLLALGVLITHGEALLGGQIYHMEDAASAYYPSHAAVWRAVARGELPEWERGAWSGVSLIANPTGLYYPGNLLFPALGMARGLAWQVALHSLAAGAAMAWLLRRRGRSWEATLLGASALGWSTFLVDRTRHVLFPQMVPWVVLAMVGVDAFCRERRRWGLPLVALSVAMALVIGAYFVPFFLLLVGAAFAAPQLAAACRRERSAGPALWLAAALGVGALAAMAQVVPTLAHLPHSPRSLGADYSFASSYAWPSFRYAITLLAPNYLGTPGHWRGVFNPWELAGYHVGALAVLLAPLSLLRRGRPELAAMLAVAALAVLLAAGDAGPVHRFLYDHLPLYATMRCPARALFMFVLLVPLLAAEGLDALLERARPSPVGKLVAIAAVASGLLLRTLLPRGDEASDAIHHLAVLVSLGVAALALAWQGAPRAAVAGAVVLLNGTDLLLTNRSHTELAPADAADDSFRYQALAWLRQNAPGERFVPWWAGPFHLHNVGLSLGMENAGGYDSLPIWRYVQFLHVLNHGRPYPHAALRDDLAAGLVTRLDAPLFDLLGVRYAMAPAAPAAHWQARFLPDPTGAPGARHDAGWDRALGVYENTRAMPRAFVVYRAIVLPSAAEQASALASLDPRVEAIVDRPLPLPDRPLPLVAARVTEVSRTRLVIEAQTPEPGLLVVTEPMYPGWEALVDGAPAPIFHANHAFRGVALGPGAHRVEMRFRSRPARAGLALSAVGLLALLALALWARRQPAAAPEERR